MLSTDDKELAKRIGKKIRELRKDKGWCQADLEAHVDEKIKRSSLSLIETGNRLPSLSALIRIAKALDVNIKAFFE